MRIIMHMDLDAFFAACEQRENPSLNGKPVVIGADPKKGNGRGVVSTCSYEARVYGIRSAMPVSRAYKLCKNAIFLKPSFLLYKEVSRNIMEILNSYTDKFAQVGIDEAYLDLTDVVSNFKEAEELGRKIKAEVYEKERLTCSIGIGPNKLIAKIGSDYKKPDGLTVVLPGTEKEFLAPLAIRKLIGVGPKTEEKLKAMGIKTIGDIAKSDLSSLGLWGEYLHRKANGISESEVMNYDEIKSISRDTTFYEDTKDLDVLFEAIDRLALRLHNSLTKNELMCRTVGIRVRFEDFETHTKETTIPATNSLEMIKTIQKQLLQGFLKDERKIRLIGVRVSGLENEKETKQVMLSEY